MDSSVKTSVAVQTSKPKVISQPELPSFFQRRLAKRDTAGVTSPKSARPWDVVDRLRKRGHAADQ
jgi:hypothetical protein